MKKSILILLFALVSTGLYAQQKEKAEELVGEGVKLHDREQYDAVIAKYDEALRLDKDNLLALVEKAFTLEVTKKYDEVVAVCERAIETHPGEKDLRNIYVAYGNSCDNLKQSEKAIKVYSDGIKRFPDFHLLYFNKAISLAAIKRYDDAINFLEITTTKKPDHANSHNLLARLLDDKHMRIPALMAYGRVLVLEPTGKRAVENLSYVNKLMNAHVEKTGDNTISIAMPRDMLDDKKKDRKKGNDFKTVDLILTLDAALDYDSANKDKTPTEQFIRKLESVCSAFEEMKETNRGFYWEYYAPYYIELKKKKMIEPFVYTIFSSSDDPKVAGWLEGHQDEVDNFKAWSEAFKWNTSAH